jgi:hypothetical protein
MARKSSRPAPTARQSKSALLEAAQEAVAIQHAKGQSRPPAPPSLRQSAARVTLGLVVLVGCGLLIARPAWLAGPAPPREPLAIRAASATMALVEAVSRVSAYREARGTLPATLGEAGVAHPEVRYRRLAGDHFEVRLELGDSTVVLRSFDPLKPAVTQAMRTLQARS